MKQDLSFVEQLQAGVAILIVFMLAMILFVAWIAWRNEAPEISWLCAVFVVYGIGYLVVDYRNS